MGNADTSSPPRPDRAAILLEAGLIAVIVLAPLPFGAVGPRSRLALELGAMALLVVWTARAWFRPTPLPSRMLCAGLVGLLGLAAIQALPLGATVVSVASPRAVEIRESSRTPGDLVEAERRLLGREPSDLEPAAALSLDPGATASTLRAGAALAALLLVATTVAAVRGARRMALALLLSAAFQGLYGLLVVASGHDRIWNVPKQYFLDSATGTFVNRNHFSCLVAMSLACGMGLIVHNVEKARRRGNVRRGRLASLSSTDGTRNLLLGVFLTVGLAGLLLSFSRAGIATGVFALVLTVAAAGRFLVLRTRLVVGALLLAAAAVPLMQLGWERLVQRYVSTASDLSSPRVTAWLDSLALIPDFPLTGTGFGAFSAAYPLVRSPEIRRFFAHVHNDALQVLVEGGVVGLFFLVLVLLPVLDRTARSIAGAKGTLAVGLAAGLTAMFLHSMVDFNFHIPSNGATAAILAGALLGLPWKRPD